MTYTPKSRIDKQLQRFVVSHPVPQAAFDHAASLHDEALRSLLSAAQLTALSDALTLSPQKSVELLLRFLLYGSSTLVIEHNFDREVDHRQRPWRVRVMLFDGRDALQADEGDGRWEVESDNLDAYAPSNDAPVLHGLNAVAEHICILATNYHGHTPEALRTAALIKKIPGLRPTLSRNDGCVTWRVPYELGGQQWVMRAEVRRADKLIPERTHEAVAKLRKSQAVTRL